jgi:hypothetical protein
MRVRRVVVPRRNQLHVLCRVVAGHARDVDRRRARNENHLFVRRISVSKNNVYQKHNFENSVSITLVAILVPRKRGRDFSKILPETLENEETGDNDEHDESSSDGDADY